VWQKIPVPNPALSNIPLTALSGQAPHTAVVNLTSGTAAPTAVTMTQLTAALIVMVGDASSGGTAGLVPAPGAGDAAAGKFLKADGTWAVPPAPSLTAYALLSSPAFVGTPTGPTQARNTNSTALATMAAIILQLAGASEILPVVDGTASSGSSTYGARIDHIHPTDTSRAAATALANYVPTARTVTGSGLVIGGGDMTANRILNVPKAAGSDITTGTDDTKAVTSKAIADAGGLGGLKSKMISITRVLNASSGTVGYTGVGFVPKAVVLRAVTLGSSLFLGHSEGGAGADKAGRYTLSVLFIDPSMVNTAVNILAGANALFLTSVPEMNSGQTADVASWDTDGFTLNWTKGGSPSAQTVTITAMCFG